MGGVSVVKPARLSAIGCGIAAGIVVALSLPAGPANAHADLLRTDPASGSVVQSLPQAVTLTFSEDVQPVVSQMQVIAPDGSRADDERVSEEATSTVRIPLRTDGPDGTYAVSYRVVSDDGHPMTGVVTFSLRVPSAVPPVPVDLVAPAVDRSLSLAMGAAGFLAVAGLVLVVGPMLFLLRLWPAGVSRRGAGRLAQIALGLIAASTVAELYLQAPYGAGGTSFAASGDAIHEVLVSRYGLIHIARLVLLAAMAVPLARVVAGRAGWVGRISSAVLTLLALATWPLSGHPRTSALPILTVVADAIHVGALALWLGGLVTLLAFVLPRAPETELSRILPAWSRWAQWTVVALVTGGVVEAVVEVRGFGQLVDTTYGRLILVKVGVLAVVLLVAAYSRRLVRPKFDVVGPEPEPDGEPAELVLVAAGGAAPAPEPEDESAEPAPVAAGGAAPAPEARPGGGLRAPAAPSSVRRGLRRSVLVETAGIVAVLGVAMALVQTAPAVAEAPSSGFLTGPGVVGGLVHMGMLQSTTSIVEVRFTPAVAGPNHVQVFAYNRAGAPLTVVSWRGTAQLPGKAPVDISLTRISGNHATGQVLLPTAGVWELRFTMTLDGAPPTSVEGTAAVRPS